MRKRLRKKLRLCEFREYAFDVSYRLRDGLPTTEADDFLFRFLEQAIEANALACGGGGRPHAYEFCVTSAGRGSPTEEQRAALGAWLADQAEVTHHSLGEFFDAWHGPDDSVQRGTSGSPLG
jgi:uncharacterized protein YggL (DUF469 family)